MNYSRRQLYALGEPLGDAATSKAGGKVIYGGGGGGGPSQQTITQSNIPDWLRPQVETVLGGAMQEMFRTSPGEDGSINVTGVKPFVPYSANPADYVAGFSPMQEQAMYGASNLQVPGQFANATGMSGISGFGGLGTAGTAQNYAAQQAGAGRQYANMATDPSSMQAYMSPYMQNVVDVQQQAAQRQADITNQASQAKFAQSGAFGGARQGIQQAQAAADLARQKQGIQAQGLQNAFQNAQQAQQFGSTLGLQGLSGAQQGLQTALGGYGLLGQQAGVMGDLGTKELAARQGIIGTQSQMGGMQQQQQQNIINQAIQNYAQAQQYPLQQYNAYNALLRGYAVPGQTATTYQAAPSLASQAAGLGMGIAGVSQLAKKKGGTIKEMAEGGVAEIDDKVRNNPTKYSEEQIKRSTANEIIDPQTAAIALGEIARARKAAQGISMLQSGLPAQGFAPGGIVAFEDGGRVERYQNRGLIRTQEEKDREALLESIRRFGLAGKDVLSAPVRGVAGAFESAVTRPLRAAGVPIPYLPESFYGGDRSSLTPYMDALRREELVKAEAERGILDRQSGATPAPRALSAPASASSAAPAAPPAPPPAGGVASLAQPPRMTAQEILSRAQEAGSTAVPAGISGAGLAELTPEKLREFQAQAMPQGEAAYTTPLTPLQEELARESREAAAAGREESRGVAERMEKLRTSQEERIKAKEKSLSTDRNQALGIAFLEAAQAMTQPGQTFFQGLTRSAAAGGKRLLEERERINAKSEKLAEALDRLDEARLGDQRERNAAEAQYRNALLGVRKEMVNNAVSAYGITRTEANQRVDSVLKRQTDIANFGLSREKAILDARQGAERNAIAAAGVAQQGVNKELEILQAAVADPRIAAAMQRNPQKNIMEYYADWMKGAGPQVQMLPSEQRIAAFLADMTVLGGPRSAPVSSRPTGTVVNQPPSR